MIRTFGGRLDAHHREVPEAKEANRRLGCEAFTRAHAIDLRDRPGTQGPVEAELNENGEATLGRHCELWEQEREVKVSVPTVSRAVRGPGWTSKKVARSLRARRRSARCLARARKAPRSQEARVRGRMLDQHRPHETLRQSPQREAGFRTSC
jgi:hypothetical protein